LLAKLLILLPCLVSCGADLTAPSDRSPDPLAEAGPLDALEDVAIDAAAEGSAPTDAVVEASTPLDAPPEATTCTPRARSECVGREVRWVSSCGVREELKQRCPEGWPSRSTSTAASRTDRR
jgi:hypothetical protein